MLAKDKLTRRQTPIEFPCYILNEVANNVDELDSKLSRFMLFTYREGFEPLPRSSVTSDKGWGCLARTCQMMLAHMLLAHMPNDFDLLHFRDIDSASAPFSLHNMVRGLLNHNHTFESGFWSPSQGCEALRYIITSAVNRRVIRTPVSVVVAVSGSVSAKDVKFRLEECGAVFLLIPIRTGMKRQINQQAFMAMDHMLQSRLSCGVVGGVPRRSYYIVGTSGQRVLYLDPHVETRPAFVNLDTIAAGDGFIERSTTLPAVSWERIDSSLLFGFFIKSLSEWTEFENHVARNAELNGGEKLFCMTQDGQIGGSRGQQGDQRRPEDAVLTWSSDEDEG